MSAIAEVLVAMGHEVSGSDLSASAAVERLRSLGTSVDVGHAPERLSDGTVVAVSTAIPPTDPEVQAAARLGLPVLSRARLLAAIARTRRTVAVSGTHGKTTTSAMLAGALVSAGLQPSFIVGGRIREFETGARWDGGDWMVVEADESDGTFLELEPALALVTSVEPDHLEHYGDFDGLVSAFDRFLGGAAQSLVCADDPMAAQLGERHGSSTYGISMPARYRMADLDLRPSGSRFVLEADGAEMGEIRVPMPGRHNALNAAGAAAAALVMGAPFASVAAGLARFAGVGRRFEVRGESAGVTYIDDYAHLPTEVSAALAAARTGGWRRVVCVFQPHRYSRTAALWAGFTRAFEGADILVVTDVYGAGEPPRPGVTGRLIVDAVLAHDPDRAVVYRPEREELVSYLLSVLQPGDLCLTLGAGDLTALPDELLRAHGNDGTGRG
jgi:UDP-N-acetylmuramate--alanine ligase